MPYPDSGGLTAEGRARREAVRLQAAALFARDVTVAQIARQFRVSHNAVYVWGRRRLADGQAGLVSKGPSGTSCRRSRVQLEGWPRHCTRDQPRTGSSRISGGPGALGAVLVHQAFQGFQQFQQTTTRGFRRITSQVIRPWLRRRGRTGVGKA
jgi:transposase-like protein